MPCGRRGGLKIGRHRCSITHAPREHLTDEVSAICCSSGQGGFLDHADTVANITLFANEVLSRLRELNPEPAKAAIAAAQ
jgi:hypothetical protein